MYARLGAFLWLFLGFAFAMSLVGDLITTLMDLVIVKGGRGESIAPLLAVYYGIISGYIFLCLATFVYLMCRIFDGLYRWPWEKKAARPDTVHE